MYTVFLMFHSNQSIARYALCTVSRSVTLTKIIFFTCNLSLALMQIAFQYNSFNYNKERTATMSVRSNTLIAITHKSKHINMTEAYKYDWRSFAKNFIQKIAKMLLIFPNVAEKLLLI